MRLADVARAAGVSVSTASRALNGYTDITESTRSRIVDVAAKLGYRAHSTARSLRVGDVGMAVAVIDAESLHPGPGRISYFWSQLLTEVVTELSRRQQALLTVMADQAAGLLGSLPYDVVLVLSTRNNLSHVIDAIPFGVPLVTASTPEIPGRRHVSLGHDYAAASAAVLDHLTAAGSRRPAVLLPMLDHSHISAFTAGAQRWYDSRGAEPMIRAGDPGDLAELVADVVGDGCDGLFCLLGDAPDTCRALVDAGVTPGQDVSLVVLSDGPVDAYLTPSVSTLELLPVQSAVGVSEAIAKVTRGQTGHIQLPYRLTVRATTSGASRIP